MKIPLIYRIVAPIILVIFTYTSCAVSETPREPSVFEVPATGDVRIMFLDTNYRVTDTDVGIMALYVENNDYAKNTLIIADIYDNNKANGVVVHIANKENNSLTSFFYSNGMNFPDRMFISADGEIVEGRFGFYDSATEKYSISFFDSTGESETLRDIPLSQSVFSAHEANDSWTETQNIRLQAIYTTLGIWASLARQMEAMGTKSGMVARGIFGKIFKFIW